MRYEERVLHHSQEFGKIRLLSKRIGTVGKINSSINGSH